MDVTTDNYELLEAVVAPESECDTLKIEDIDFAGKYEAVVLGVYQQRLASEKLLREG